MSRLPPLDMDNLDPDQKAAYDEIASGPRGDVYGPFAELIRGPAIADLVQRFGAYIRFECSLPGNLRELAILCVGRHWSAQYEWYAHAKIALEEGVDPAIIEAIRNRETPEFTDDAERTVHAYATEMMATGQVSDATFKATHDLLGDRGLVDLIGLLGHYCTISITLNSFQVEVPGGDVPLT